MKVHDVMTTDPRCCRSTDTLNDACRIMWDHDCGFVPVVDQEARVVGVLTDRDALMATYTQGEPPTALSLTRVMSTQVVGCRPSDPLQVAETLMRDHQIRRLVVLDDDARLAGVISLNDLATGGTPRLELAETLSAISRPHRRTEATD